MRYTDFETLFIDVLARDIIDDKTVVRYIDEKDDIKKLEISKVDYDILPNHKLLVTKVNDDVIGYYKNNKDILNYTSCLQNDIANHSVNPRNSKFIISDEEDDKKFKKSNLKSIVPPLTAALSAWGLFLSYLLLSNGKLQIFFAFLFVFFGMAALGLYTRPSFINDGTINRQYVELYKKFILDFEQSLADNKHKF